jgi:hypothetical protein
LWEVPVPFLHIKKEKRKASRAAMYTVKREIGLPCSVRFPFYKEISCEVYPLTLDTPVNFLSNTPDNLPPVDRKSTVPILFLFILNMTVQAHLRNFL